MSIEQIRAREQAASKGPWRLGGSGIIAVAGVEYITSCVRTDSDAAFIAHARQDVPALLVAVDTVLALHQPEKRWEPYEGAGISFKTSTEAITAASEVDLGVCAESPASFEVCAECARIESEQLVEMGEDWGYRESLWPCATVSAITEALKGAK